MLYNKKQESIKNLFKAIPQILYLEFEFFYLHFTVSKNKTKPIMTLQFLTIKSGF